MISGEGEVVPFKKSLYPRGNVQDWLLEVENTMQYSLRTIIEEAIEDYGIVSHDSLTNVYDFRYLN